MGPVEIVFLAVPIGIVALLMVGLRRTTRHEEAEGWAAGHGIRLNDQTRKVVDEYLHRSRKFKLAGAVVGIVLPLGTQLPGAEMIGGYLIGAVLAEWKHPRLAGEKQPTASLVPRSVNDYLPSFVVPVLRSSMAGAALLGAAYFWGPERSSVTDLGVGFGAAFAAAMLLPPGIEMLLRKIVGRSQPSGDPQLIAVDDAMRSSSLHAVGGAGLALVMLLLGGMLWAVGLTSDLDAIRWILPITGVAVAILGMVVWFKLGGETSWKVRRNQNFLGAAS